MAETIKTLKIEDRDYPLALKKIERPPALLYYQGEKPKGRYLLAIVGTRRCSHYGQTIAFSLARDLAQQGITIVSGLARGIDRAAHKGSLAGQGKTIAVLGTGLDRDSFYPKENFDLRKAILSHQGSIISEYPAGTRGSRFTFPERNRLISGLSLATLVIEGYYSSGAMITARWAARQNKKILALPGPINSLNAKGPHQLIKAGAALVENAEDVLRHLNLKSKKDQKKEKGSDKDKTTSLILSALKKEPLSLDKIIKETDLPPKVVSAHLSLMELSGQVKHMGGSIYSLPL